ncbi:MAG TPA: sulfotransferase family protein [Chloroflexi bacterium]|nr:sulfotransferase family protein [Chloroflexota bacterium]
MNQQAITIVSGLPRSGTSMMMKMLEAGGLPVLTDNLRTPDPDNPRGYYEFERVKKLEHDKSWLKDARGKAVKIIAALLKHLPPDHHYKIIFMRRDMDEILASQRRMLIRRGEATDKISDEKLAQLFEHHLRQTEAWLAEQPNIDVTYVNYNDVLENPDASVERIEQFLGGWLDADNMVRVIDPSLYRQRRQ